MIILAKVCLVLGLFFLVVGIGLFIPYVISHSTIKRQLDVERAAGRNLNVTMLQWRLEGVVNVYGAPILACAIGTVAFMLLSLLSWLVS